MVIIVTGGAGYIGTFFIKRLLAEKAIKKIIGIDLRPQPKELNGVPLGVDVSIGKNWGELSRLVRK